MAYVDQSRSTVVGSYAAAEGSIDDSVDMQFEYGFGSEHSAEFDRKIQQLKPFYNRLLDEFLIPRNP
jgi:hypothetical protein